MCTMIVKEAIAHYVAGGSQVICIFIDASNAFDKIEYGKLFNLLFRRNLPACYLDNNEYAYIPPSK